MTDSRTAVTIRPLKIWELPAFLDFQVENDYSPLPEEVRVRESLVYSLLKILWHNQRLATFVAVNDMGLLGYASLVFGKYKKFQGNAYLVSIAVKKSERGRGIGSSLFSHIENSARSRGARRIEFEVFSRNTEAIKLYKRLGYEIEGVKRKVVKVGNEYDDLVFMAKFID